MYNKAFNKKLTHRCEYCVYATALGYGQEIICRRHGITQHDDNCRNYKYDPLKRTPKLGKISDNYSPEDFSL